MLGESQTRPRAEGVEHIVEIFSFLREVIRATVGKKSRIISMTFDKEGLILAFFSKSMENRIFYFAVNYFRYWASIYFSDHSQILQEFKQDEDIILARVPRDFKNPTLVSTA